MRLGALPMVLRWLSTGFFEMRWRQPVQLVLSSENMLAMQQGEGKKGSSVSSYFRTALIFVFALLSLWHLAVEQAQRQEVKELHQIKAELLAELVSEVKSLTERLDSQLLRESEAKSDFDLFNEQFLKSRAK